MSLIEGFVSPKDLLLKMFREGRRTHLSEREEDVADHFLNFCITAHSLRDWCIKEKSIPQQSLHDYCNKSIYLEHCRDIANSSKHFGLRSGSGSTVQQVSNDIAKFQTINSNGEILEDHHDRNTLIIELPDGTEQLLMMFLYNVGTKWLEIFDFYNIDALPETVVGEMFIDFK
ncbi:hypothetical protein [Pseudoalteromonas prydzensis]|uniref:hypothetical protein n=1 Tax=Pseudoalteromonas prydzensis TaxID=182141 RepID=UPI0007E50D17|nr:hypothetical protein [Pseudoalteromonas prydzensis]MBE0378318.1 hypothetical protein [Pseudoalteromonas prydzensis ACAM 620]